MTKRRGKKPTGIDAYRLKAAAAMRGNPSCHWCIAPAKTAVYETPLLPGQGYPRLVPGCVRCSAERRCSQAWEVASS